MRCLWLWIGALGWLGCGSPAPGDDAGAGDGAVDASAVDASAADGSAADAGAADGSATLDAGPDGGTPSGLTLPPPNAPFDYQLGGAYPPPEGVMVVSRDRTDPPAAGLYNICYVNGFQVQPNEEDFWLEEEPDLILRDGSGDPVVDDGWDEMLIDVGTPEKRGRVAVIVGEWITGCADAGYDAVEIDNLDSFSRSRGLLDEDDAVAMMALFSATAHAYGLAIAQKNSAELVGRRAEMGTDFVVAEECNRWDECDVYTGVYGDDVLVVEYRRSDFEAGCADFPQLSIVLRDLELVTPGSAGYVYDGC